VRQIFSARRWLALAIVGLIGGLGWALRPGPPDPREAAQAAWQQGNWRSATRRYQQIVDGGADADSRLALAELRWLRGEETAATTLVSAALSQPLSAQQRDRAELLRGWLALAQGDSASVIAAAAAVSADQRGPASLLLSDLALRSGDIVSATNRLNAAGALEGPWRAYGQWRAAQLALTSAPSTTAALLDSLDLPERSVAVPPLDPAVLGPRLAALRAATTLDQDARQIALARIWAAEGLPQAASALLRLVPEDSSYAALAVNEQARLRWTLGDPRGALADLAAAVARFPNVPDLRRTQVTLAVAVGDVELARTALIAATQMDGLSAENYVSSAVLALSVQDFNAAAAAYDRAIETSPLSGTYNLQAANFYVAAPLRVCTTGRAYAQRAIGSAVDADARRLEGQLALRCNDAPAVLRAIAPLLAGQPDDAQLSYLAGAALWRLGQRALAGHYLERAANLAPGSQWMQQAELLIGPP
jgi:hypothetical protein